MSTLKILYLFPTSYEAAFNTFDRHFYQECEECNEQHTCPRGEQLAMLAFSLLSPQPRRSQPDCQRRRAR